MKTLKCTALLIVASLTIVSCREEDKIRPELEVETLNNESQVQAEFDDLLSVVEDAMEPKDSVMGARVESLLSCGTITINTVAKTITIDFGNSGVICNDGRSRKGVVNISYSGRYRDSTTVITTTLSNYEVKPIASQDFVKVEGTKTVTNKGRNSQGKITFEVVVQNGKLTFTDNTNITFNSTRTRVWDKGSETNFQNSGSVLLALQDDEYLISGTTSGTSRSGQSFSSQMNNLRIKLGCWLGAPVGQRFRYPVSGTKSVTTDLGTRTLDFGSGNCDASVTYTGINGNTINLTLPSL